MFSLIFHTEFYCYDVPNSKRGEDIRLRDLLSLVGLTERLLSGNENIPSELIDFSNVELSLKPLKESSIRFLERNILFCSNDSTK